VEALNGSRALCSLLNAIYTSEPTGKIRACRIGCACHSWLSRRTVSRRYAQQEAAMVFNALLAAKGKLSVILTANFRQQQFGITEDSV